MPEHPDQSAGESLLRLGGPVLITLDEAHMVEPAALRILLNAVQDASDRMSIALVLAGPPPGLIDRLQGTGASFWDRGRHLPMGHLSPEAARDVIARPLLNADLTHDPASIKRLTEEANFYPFFLQLYGAAAFDAVMLANTKHFGTAECNAAIRESHEPRCRYYARRKWEFMDQTDGWEVARRIALAFENQKGTLTTTQVQRALDDLDPNQTMDRWRFLRQKGYIWDGPVTDSWEPGIPSLMKYMIETTGPPSST